MNKNTNKIHPDKQGFVIKDFSSWLVLSIVVLFIVFIRMRLLDIPLERDEGEYAYMGQLILKGIPPYKMAYNMKFPGTSLMYALLMAIFGETARGIHLGLLFINITSIILVLQLAKKIFSSMAATISAAAFGILSLSSSVFGFAAHATHFVILFALAGILLLLNAEEKEKPPVYYLVPGALLALSPIMKQPGIFFCLFGGLMMIINYITAKEKNLKKLLIKVLFFTLGLIITFIIMFASLKAFGTFDRFWFWTIDYASAYGNQVPKAERFSNLRSAFIFVMDGFYIIWIINLLGLVLVFFNSKLKKNCKLFIVLFLVFSFLSICPGFYFRYHYFILILPATALMCGSFFDYLISKIKPGFVKPLVAAIFLLALIPGIAAQKEYFFEKDPDELSRKFYGPNPFSECEAVGEYISGHSDKSDMVAVLGSEPQIYFYANRISATGYVYTYSLVEDHKYKLGMQKEMIHEIEATRPRFLVFIKIPLSWGIDEFLEIPILDWANNYIKKNNYQRKGLIDIFQDHTDYKWDNDAVGYQPKSPFFIEVLERPN